jgi:hypothetical protein
MALVKSLYCLPTWTRAVALVRDHPELHRVLGAPPSVFACYRLTAKLRENSGALDTSSVDSDGYAASAFARALTQRTCPTGRGSLRRRAASPADPTHRYSAVQSHLAFFGLAFTPRV